MYIPIEGFWSYVQTRVGTGTPHKIQKCLRSRGGDTAHSKRTFVIQSANGGTPHKPNDTSVLRVGGLVGGRVGGRVGGLSGQ